jgi:hypothetical protein
MSARHGKLTGQGGIGRRSNLALVALVAAVALLVAACSPAPGPDEVSLPGSSGPPAVPAASPTPSLGAAEPSVPSEAPAPRLVAYTVSTPGVGQCSACYTLRAWVAAIDGTGARPVLPSPGELQEVDGWSADGSRLLIENNDGLYLADANGSAPVLVAPYDTCHSESCSNGPGSLCSFPCTMEEGFALSPDGTRVAFVRGYANDDDATVIAILDLGSGRVTDLTSTRATTGSAACSGASSCQGSNGWLRWSPDGRRIAFVRQLSPPLAGKTRTMAEVWVVDADGGNLHRITPDGMYPTEANWSPDGTRLVLMNLDLPSGKATTGARAPNVNIYTIGADGSGLARLTDDGVSARPAWTSDGRISFLRLSKGKMHTPQADWVMAADGTNPARLGTSLTDLTAADCQTCIYPVIQPDPTKVFRGFWQPEP